MVSVGGFPTAYQVNARLTEIQMPIDGLYFQSLILRLGV